MLQNRASLAQAILGHGSPGLLRRRFAELWHVLAVLYILTVCFIWLVRPDGGFEFVARATLRTFVILFAAWAVAESCGGWWRSCSV